MPITTYELYLSTDLVFSGNTVSLVGGYDGSNDVILVVDDDDDVLDGDLFRNEDGNDTNQFGTATFADGTVLGGPTTTVYSEQQYTLTAPDGTTITLYQIEVDSNPNSTAGAGILAGYLPSEPLVPGVVYTITVSNTIPGNSPQYDDIEGAVCLTRGAGIATPGGLIPVEMLKEGDLVETRNGAKPIRWIGSCKLDASALSRNPKLRPVRITQGALGNGLPNRDLLVSRQHRMLVSSQIAQRMFGQTEALIAAVKMTEWPGIYVDNSVTDVEYFHILFDSHEVIFADGAPTESLFTGPEALKMFPAAMREEILTLFPELDCATTQVEPACIVPNGKQQKTLISRHMKNNKPFLSMYQG